MACAGVVQAKVLYINSTEVSGVLLQVKHHAEVGQARPRKKQRDISMYNGSLNGDPLASKRDEDHGGVAGLIYPASTEAEGFPLVHKVGAEVAPTRHVQILLQPAGAHHILGARRIGDGEKAIGGVHRHLVDLVHNVHCLGLGVRCLGCLHGDADRLDHDANVHVVRVPSRSSLPWQL